MCYGPKVLWLPLPDHSITVKNVINWEYHKWWPYSHKIPTKWCPPTVILYGGWHWTCLRWCNCCCIMCTIVMMKNRLKREICLYYRLQQTHYSLKCNYNKTNVAKATKKKISIVHRPKKYLDQYDISFYFY